MLVTHQVHLLRECDLVIVLSKDGDLKVCCRYDEISQEELSQLLHVNESYFPQTEVCGCSSIVNVDNRNRDRSSSITKAASIPENGHAKKVNDGSKLMENEDRKTGLGEQYN